MFVQPQLQKNKKKDKGKEKKRKGAVGWSSSVSSFNLRKGTSERRHEWTNGERKLSREDKYLAKVAGVSIAARQYHQFCVARSVT